ncbi:MAG: DUF881 domain-containing protein [Jatrophihabitantaceae bacterium]
MPDDQSDAAPDTGATQARQSLWRAHRIAFTAMIAVLTGLLGFAIVLQVRQNSGSDNLANLREDDLVGILDDQNARADRLRQQIDDLQQTLRRLRDSGNQAAAARQQAAQDVQALGVLLGTVAADGPGVRVRVTDPGRALGPEDLLDVVEELRGAGAEAIQFGRVRVSTATAFTGSKGNVAVDGTNLIAPYQVLAIGDPKTLDTALNIPGGVAAAIRNTGGDLTVAESRSITISATRALPAPKYASPSPH